MPAEHARGLVDLLVDEVLDHRSIALAPPADPIEEPDPLRRTDGSSVYTVAGADLYTSQRILDAETRLVAAAGTTQRVSRRPRRGGSRVTGDGGQRHRRRCGAGIPSPPDVHLWGTAAVSDRP